MFNLSQRKVVFHDYGIFLSMARVIGAVSKEAAYHTPFMSSFTRPEKAMIGEGIPDIVNAPDFDEAVKELDPKRDWIVFFDCGEPGKQEQLRRDGYTVFGMGPVEKWEQNRSFFKKQLEKLGLAVPEYKYIVGIDNLGKELEKDHDWWVKINTFRGLSETFWAGINWKLRVKALAHQAGAFAPEMEFIIERKIKGPEFGTDIFISKAGPFSKLLFGIEDKNCSYSCKVIEYNSLPKPILEVHQAIDPAIIKQGGMGMYSTEMRMAEGLIPYFGDMSSRSGSPPGEIIGRNYKNFPEACYAAAKGERIQLEEVKPYAAQVILKSGWAKEESTVVKYPDKIKDLVMLRNLCFIEDEFKFIPSEKCEILGSAIGLGDTLEEAQAQALEVASQVEADEIYYDKYTFDRVDETIEEGRTMGLQRSF